MARAAATCDSLWFLFHSTHLFHSTLDNSLHFAILPSEILPALISINQNPEGGLWPGENETPFLAGREMVF